MSASVAVVLGPILLACVFNSILFGTCLVQTATYFSSQFKDKWPFVTLVCWVFCVDVLHSISLILFAWHCIVDSWGNTAALGETIWEYDWSPVFFVLISAPVQFFLTWRIYKLSDNIWVFGICIVTLISSGFGIYATHAIVSSSTTTVVKKLVSTGDAWLGTGILSDALITFSLSYYLAKKRTGLASTNRLIMGILTTAVVTAVPVLVIAIIDIAMLSAFPASNLFFMFAVCLPRLYTNTLLTTLNSRTRMNRDIENAKAWENIHLSRIRTTTTGTQHTTIDVERQIDNDMKDGNPTYSGDMESSVFAQS